MTAWSDAQGFTSGLFLSKAIPEETARGQEKPLNACLEGVGWRWRLPGLEAQTTSPKHSAQAFPSSCSRTCLILVGCLICYRRKSECHNSSAYLSLLMHISPHRARPGSSRSPIFLSQRLQMSVVTRPQQCGERWEEHTEVFLSVFVCTRKLIFISPETRLLVHLSGG